MKTQLSPTSTQERIQALDILRGVAILGILIMNIQSFAMPSAAYLNPTAFGSLEGLNKWVWAFSHLFADQKFMTLFSLLFGAGILLVTDRAEAKGGSALGFHYKRNFWLLVIGLIHAHLIWYGDILVTYALCSFFVVLLRNWKPRTLLITGVLFMSVASLFSMGFASSFQFMPEAELMEMRLDWKPSTEMIDEEIAAITGSLSEQIAHNSESAVEMETVIFFFQFLWRAGGLMMIGMALYKWGIITGKRTLSFYGWGLLASFIVGIPLILIGMNMNTQAEWSFEYSMFVGSQYNYWGSLFVSFGYLCFVMIFSKSEGGLWVKQRLAAIGQMALTNYLMQSVICVFIFFGVGLGLFGQVDRVGQFLITIGIWALQFMWSKPWLERYRFGPMEWLWRSLSYGKSQAMSKSQN